MATAEPWLAGRAPRTRWAIERWEWSRVPPVGIDLVFTGTDGIARWGRILRAERSGHLLMEYVDGDA